MAYKYNWFCRWCGCTYDPTERTERDGFCSSKHKQAHYRAYKKYVTQQGGAQPAVITPSVTQKKSKKQK